MTEERVYKTFVKIAENQNSNVNPAYSPKQIRTAYNVPEDYTGEGNTIAIVVAYGNPTIIEDTEVFTERFGLPPADIEIVYAQEIPPIIDPGWQVETCLDIQWSHSIAPLAKKILIVAEDSTFDKLNEAVALAVRFGANIVSMSWGAREEEDQLQFDSLFKDQGVIFLASSGDDNFVSYPSSSPYVIGVGGTSLQLDGCGERVTEELAWTFNGGGISQFYQKPSYQYIRSIAQPKTDMLTCPDVSLYADSFPGVPVYVTPVGESGTWLTLGGTSLSCPCMAGVMALAIPPNTRTNEILDIIYYISDGCETVINNPYVDIQNGNTTMYPALKGFDYVTGLGSPDVANFIKSIREYFEEY